MIGLGQCRHCQTPLGSSADDDSPESFAIYCHNDRLHEFVCRCDVSVTSKPRHSRRATSSVRFPVTRLAIDDATGRLVLTTSNGVSSTSAVICTCRRQKSNSSDVKRVPRFCATLFRDNVRQIRQRLTSDQQHNHASETRPDLTA